MPVSPQDYALWSDLTGNPYPQTPAERMALAPEVYSFTRDVNQGRRPPGAIRRAVDVIGKTALAAGAIAGGVYLAKNFGTLELDDEPHIGTPPQPQGVVPVTVTDVTPPTTSDRYGQDVVPHQTAVMGLLRGTSPGKPTVVDSEEKPATQSHVISTSQSFGPGSEIEQLATSAVPHSPVRDRADDLIAEYLGGIAAEQRDQIKIDKSIDIHNAAIQGKMAPYIKQLNKEGRAEGISPVGGSSVAAAERFRGTPAYTAMMQAAGASMEPEELVGAPGTTPVFTEVRATPQKRGTPISDSLGADLQTLGKIIANHTRGLDDHLTRQAQRIEERRRNLLSESEETSALAAKALALMPRAQREALLGGQTDAPIITQQPEAVRVGKPVKVRTNEFLSAMSQDQGPLASYEIEPERSKAISGLTFYPGGELGVEMKSRGKPVEYAYATADPYRLAMRDYADEGFPDEMGNIAGIAANNALAHQMGLQKAVERGGTVREKRQPIYTGLMSEADIVAAGMGKNVRAKEQAERHFETRQIMEELEQRAAARRTGLL